MKARVSPMKGQPRFPFGTPLFLFILFFCFLLHHSSHPIITIKPIKTQYSLAHTIFTETFSLHFLSKQPADQTLMPNLQLYLSKLNQLKKKKKLLGTLLHAGLLWEDWAETEREEKEMVRGLKGRMRELNERGIEI